MKLIITGYMGSGKTAVGKALAAETGLEFLDLDKEISNKEGRSISEIFAGSGEIYFRRKETEVLKDLLQQEKEFILSLGGGTPCYGKNLQLIKDEPGATSVYLKTGIEELKQRLINEKESRPLIKELESDQFFIGHVIEEEVFNQLHSEIKMLPDASQKIMILSLKGKKIKEIAQQLGISENTVKTQKKLAYAKLRTKLSSDLKGILLSI